MENARILNGRFNENIDSLKMELDMNHSLNHSKNVRSFIFSRRNIEKNNFNNNMQEGNKIFDNEFNNDLINSNINEIIILFERIHQNNSLSLNKNQINEIKSVLLNYLVGIRKELTNEKISIIQAKSIFNNNTKIFVEALLNPIYDTCDPYIQLESLWIINNLLFLVAKFKETILFEVSNIANLLIGYLKNIYKNQKNDGVKYTLEEKIIRIFGNLLYINNDILKLLINYEIIPFIISSLNSPIPSFRTACLWLINKMLLIIKKTGNNNLISYFTTKNALSNYKFILSRIHNQHCFDEIGELFWIFNELVKYDSAILIPIFFTDNNNINNGGFANLNKEYILNKFKFILDNCLSNKMFQPCIRLISNLLMICYKDINDGDLLSTLIQLLFSKENIFQFITDLFQSQSNKLDVSLIEDILLLIFNLISITPNKSSPFFKNLVINLISNKEYQNNNKILKLLFFIYYKVMKANNFCFEYNDENVIKSILFLIQNFKDDSSVLYIIIDLFYFYLRALNVKIDGNIENDINRIINTEDNIQNNELIIILLNLSNYIKAKFNLVY